jgi:hypothetical protein
VVTRARSLAAALSLVAALIGVAVAPGALAAHPLHSTITEITQDRAKGVVRATIRVFADDFGTAVGRSAKGRATPAGPDWDAAVAAYLATSFGLQDAQGRSVSVRSCGVKRIADLLWLCVEGATTQPLETLRVRNAILCDLFDDQVNVVQGTTTTGRRSLLFVRGDPYKSMR